MVKKYLILLILLVSFVLVSGFGAAAETYTLRFATMPHRPHTWITVMENFAEEVESQTDGNVLVTLYTGGQLGTDEAVFDDMEVGAVDMNVGTAANATTVVPEFQLLSFNYLFVDQNHLEAAVDPDGEVFQAFSEIVEERQPHLKLMPFMGGGTRNVNTTFGPVTEPDDFEGITMRVMESPIEDEMWASLGSSTTTIPFTELYTAIQTGVADAFESSTVGYLGNSLYEVAEYHNRTEHEYMVGVWFVNRDTFEELPEEYQEIVMNVARETAMESIGAGLEEEEEVLEELSDRGVEINRDVNVAAFAEALQPLHEEFAEDIGVSEVLDLIINLDY